MKVALFRSALLAGLALAGACDGAAAPLDASSRAYVQSVEAGLARGSRPDAQGVERLKALAVEHPDDEALGKLLLALLPGLKDWEGLARWLEAKRELDDDERVALAKVYVNLGDYDAAWRAVAPVAQREPGALEPNALAARAAYFRGDGAEAARGFDRVWDALCAAGRTEEMSYRAMLFLDAGELDRARSVLELALAKDPDSPYAHNALARVLAAAGDEAGAKAHEARAAVLQDALTAAAKRQMRSAAENNLMNEAAARGDFEGAERLVLRFLADADAERADELLRYLESLYRAAGREAEAPAALEAARRVIPSSARR